MPRQPRYKGKVVDLFKDPGGLMVTLQSGTSKEQFEADIVRFSDPTLNSIADSYSKNAGSRQTEETFYWAWQIALLDDAQVVPMRDGIMLRDPGDEVLNFLTQNKLKWSEGG